MRTHVIHVVVSTVLVLGGVAAAGTASGSDPAAASPSATFIPDTPSEGVEPSPVEPRREDASAGQGSETGQPSDERRSEQEGLEAQGGPRHGGRIERFHDAAGCNLVDLSGLPAIWTHGDYVSAVVATGDEEHVAEAARSRCGKPAHAGGPPAHAGGPPAHAGGPPPHAEGS